VPGSRGPNRGQPRDGSTVAVARTQVPRPGVASPPSPGGAADRHRDRRDSAATLPTGHARHPPCNWTANWPALAAEVRSPPGEPSAAGPRSTGRRVQARSATDEMPTRPELAGRLGRVPRRPRMAAGWAARRSGAMDVPLTLALLHPTAAGHTLAAVWPPSTVSRGPTWPYRPDPPSSTPCSCRAPASPAAPRPGLPPGRP